MSKFQKKAENELLLKKRLKLNKNTQKKDFQLFLFKKLNLDTDKVIMDLGCGHGQTSLSILKTKNYLKLYSIDINRKFINNLKFLKKKYKNFYPIKKNMDLIKFENKKFHLIIMSYCFYYSKNYKKLLLKLIKLLKEDGKIIIANPYKPHFMVNFISRIHSINKTVFKSLEVSDYIYKFCKNQKSVSVKKFVFKNETTLNKKNILSSYTNSTMFNKNKLELVKQRIKKLKNNKFRFFKSTCLIEINKN
ncbi:class I SAM-dependent methyltransferase [Pelagibacterales bacterium SAG-MED38]|nr:class I SAM-dependent methyltransferase [Pelagibacterales bacterium SAG-MED38]